MVPPYHLHSACIRHTTMRSRSGLLPPGFGYHMLLVLALFVLALVGSLATGGCGSPVQASSVPLPSIEAHAYTVPEGSPAPYVPAHHNIPATFAGMPNGATIWLCATQPRGYSGTDGAYHLEEDHYLQYAPCPIVPIR